ncbi:hypothetical protein [Sphingomonas lenta]|uniref:hypothetical protein n=1 Tax=Sphingomonas lenta TaxID=1141887 RepID=UPI0015962179|nr:hypothetical protein [Sphingomonas lenta]
MATTTANQTNQSRTAGAKDAINQNLGKAKAFAKQRPAATAALAGVLGLALLNTLRGR